MLHGGATCEDNGVNDMRTVVNMETGGDSLNVLIAYGVRLHVVPRTE